MVTDTVPSLVEDYMRTFRAELIANGIDPAELTIWCHFITGSTGDTGMQWTVFCKRHGADYHVSGALQSVLKQLRSIASLDAATREALLSL